MPLTALHPASSSEPTAGKSLPRGGKQLQFLATKVVSPRSLGVIDRPRLLAMTSQLPSKRPAVIKAPSGFGKTSLAASWLERLHRDAGSVEARSQTDDRKELGLG
jgi:LuxR family transcriptional regulator, maltose regulon positive regulatory protein